MRWRRRGRLCANICCFLVFLVSWLCDTIAGYATTITFTILFTAIAVFPFLWRVLRAVATTPLMTMQSRLFFSLSAVVLLPPWLFFTRLVFSFSRISRASKRSLTRIRCTAIAFQGLLTALESVHRLNDESKALAVRIRRSLATRAGPIDIDIARLVVAVLVGVPIFLAVLTPVVVVVSVVGGPRALFRYWRVSRDRCKAWVVPIALSLISPLLFLAAIILISGLAISRVYIFGLRGAVMAAILHYSKQFCRSILNIGDYDTQMVIKKYGKSALNAPSLRGVPYPPPADEFV